MKDIPRANGSFAASGRFTDPPNPTIYLSGIGNMALPLTNYPFNPEDNFHAQFDPSDIKVLNPRWDTFLSYFVERHLGAALGVSSIFGTLSATLAAVTIQGSGSGWVPSF
jgi:hypothetical protein